MRVLAILAAVATATVSLLGQAPVASAFVVPSFLSLRYSPSAIEKSNAIMMACRFNAKREKRKRNGENARKYRMKNTGPKYLAIKTRKRASKAEYSKRLEQYEMDFTSQIYTYEDVDALLAAASPPTEDA